MSIVTIDMNKPIIKEWHEFIKRGKKPANVREEILKSWERSKEFKINPFGGKSNKILSTEEINKKLISNQKIISVAETYINRIYQNIRGLGYLVFLTDHQADLLYIAGDDDILYCFKQELNFQIGAAWCEDAVGTTAVSMAMTKGTSVPFMAEEKYCYELKKKACSAVPIRNIDGEIVAILGAAANFPQPNGQVFGMLLAAQMAIENQLRLMKINEELHLISNYYKAVFQSVVDPIITVNHKGIIVDINQKAVEIIGEGSKKICGRQACEILEFYPIIMDVMKTGIEFESNGTMIDTKDKKSYYSIKKIIPIYDNNKAVNGCINILTPGHRKSTENQIQSNTTFKFDDIIGKGKGIEKVKRMAVKAASTKYNILIMGESGTGKELFAQAIHSSSSRKKGAFIAINCGAIPKDLIESEFFGYETGAFTGAAKGGKPGKFELARGGTIFLDEIGEMSKTLQIRLLRVLQQKEVMRIGGTKTIPVDVRVIAATNKNLMEEVQKGNFREDLFWRLNVIPLNIPNLSQRKEDIPLLIEHFIKKHADCPQEKYRFDNESLDILMNYHWPGNVRELENVIERILVFADQGVILPEHLPEYMLSEKFDISLCNKYSLDQIEQKIIQNALKENNGNITKTAKTLGISRNTLYNKLKACNYC
ncbi:sigma 54-interacting transcriptional regulator [Clostridiaceae bacterium 35-E11]